MKKVAVLTLFPEMFSALTEQGVTSRAIKEKFVQLRCFNPRDYTEDKHKTVDDKPYGGGPGMVMKAEPLFAAFNDARSWLGTGDAKVVYLSPQGKQFNVEVAQQYTQTENFIFVCGRYEGIDQRFIDLAVNEELSIGDYVLSGGELATMVVLDSVFRRIPGVLGGELSVDQDSFEHIYFDHPHYTRPEKLDKKKIGVESASRKNDLSVPNIIMSGDHAKIRAWRQVEAKRKTLRVRPDLFKD